MKKNGNRIKSEIFQRGFPCKHFRGVSPVFAFCTDGGAEDLQYQYDTTIIRRGFSERYSTPIAGGCRNGGVGTGVWYYQFAQTFQAGGETVDCVWCCGSFRVYNPVIRQ